MKAMKAKPVTATRELKTFRLKPDVLVKSEKLAAKLKVSQSEAIEKAVELLSIKHKIA